MASKPPRQAGGYSQDDTEARERHNRANSIWYPGMKPLFEVKPVKRQNRREAALFNDDIDYINTDEDLEDKENG